MTESTLQSVLR